MDLDAVGLVRLRLGEHALHTWDVAVRLDPAATVSPDAVDLLIDNVPQFLAPRLGKTPADPFAVRIRTTGPDRDYLLATADTVIMTDWPEDGTDVPVGEVSHARRGAAAAGLRPARPGAHAGRGHRRPRRPGPAARDLPGLLTAGLARRRPAVSG